MPDLVASLVDFCDNFGSVRFMLTFSGKEDFNPEMFLQKLNAEYEAEVRTL